MMGAGSGRLAVLHKSRSHTLEESGSIRQPVTQDYCADMVPSFKHCRSPASQPRIPAMKSSNGVLSSRLDSRTFPPELIGCGPVAGNLRSQLDPMKAASGGDPGVPRRRYIVAVMRVRAPPASPRRASARQIAIHRPLSRTCPGSGARQPSGVASHHRP
jgi:hypothetical protein